MTPTSFDFTVTLPGDERLVGAVRQLAAQAAGYAQLTADAGEGLASHVEEAAAAAVRSTGATDAPIELRICGEPDAIEVRISCRAAAAAPPDPVAADGLSVNWRTEGARQTCHIRQRVPA